MAKLLSVGTDSKTVKGEEFGYYTAIQYLAPSDESSVMNTCPHASNGCRAACLYTAGFARVYKTVNESRIKKTLSFHASHTEYIKTLIKEIESLIKKAKKDDMKLVVRLNGTSDIAWESITVNDKSIMEYYPDITFYDYTKDFARMMRFIDGKMPINYHLTFSRSEDNQEKCEKILTAGGNVAVVFRNSLPSKYMGKKVIDGDLSDLRFNDEKNVIVGLTEKGKAKKDKSGFVVEPE